MDFINFIINNYVMLFELIGIFVILFITIHVPKIQKRYFRTTVILLAIAIVAENIEAFTQTLETYTPWRFILTCVKYLIYPLILMMFIESMAYGQFKISNKTRLIFYLPEYISVPLYFTSQWTHWIVYFDTEKNVWHGGVLQYWPYGIFIFYVLIFVIISFYTLRNYTIRDRVISLFITLGSFAYVVLHLILGKSNDYTPIFTSALVFYIFFIYIHQASIDPLTHLMNRQSYYHDISIRNERIRAVVSVDMNELKYLNDTFGHDKGDEGLKKVGEILLAHAGYHKRVYRTGGDEFFIFYSISNEEEIQNRIKLMKEDLSLTEYSCSFGYCMKHDNEKITDVIKRADEMMYVEKRERKQQLIKEGKSTRARF